MTLYLGISTNHKEPPRDKKRGCWGKEKDKRKQELVKDVFILNREEEERTQVDTYCKKGSWEQEGQKTSAVQGVLEAP